MSVVIAAVVLVGTLCVADLLLTIGVIRRLREHTEALTAMQGARDAAPPTIAVGDEVGPFAATTADGAQLRHSMLADRTLVGFFAPTCTPCVEQLPDFLAFAGAAPGGAERVLAVVVSDVDPTDELVSQLRGVSRVVVERYDGVMAHAFGVRAFPTVIMVAPGSDGRLRVVDNHVDLRDHDAATA